MGESGKDAIRVGFDGSLKLEFHGSKITSDAGLIPYRELDETLVLTDTGAQMLADWRMGKNAVKWTKLSCHDFADNQVRLQLFALAYNLGNFLRRFALPPRVKHWSLIPARRDYGRS